MNDLIKRLNRTPLYEGSGEESGLPEEVAAELARLTAENASLRAVIAEAQEIVRTALAGTAPLDANAEITALRTVITEAREALEPFMRADRAIGDEQGPFRFETGTGYRLFEREDLRRASAALAHIDAPLDAKQEELEMTMVEAHATSDGFEITARLTAPNGAKLVYTTRAETLEEAQALMVVKIEQLLSPEEPKESS